MVIVGDTMHNVLDGVLIAAAFLIDINLGMMTGIAVLAHEVPSEVGNFAVLLHSGMTPGACHVLEPVVGPGFGDRRRAGLLRAVGVRPWLPYALGVSAASLLYVAVADLIPGLHRRVDLEDQRIAGDSHCAWACCWWPLVEHLHPH